MLEKLACEPFLRTRRTVNALKTILTPTTNVYKQLHSDKKISFSGSVLFRKFCLFLKAVGL